MAPEAVVMNDFYAALFEGMAAGIAEQGQPITVLFGDGSTRDILALVFRERIHRVPEARETTAPVISVIVLNLAQSMTDDPNGVGGIGYEELDRGTTRLKLPRRLGIDPEQSDPQGRTIKNIPAQFPSGMLLEL